MDPVQETETSQGRWGWALVITVNLAVLAELCIAMYLASAAPDEFEPTFLKAFFGMLLPTLALGFIGKRCLRPSPVRSGG